MIKTTLTRNKFSVVMAALYSFVLLFSSLSLAQRSQSVSVTAVTVQQVQSYEISQSLSLVGKLKAKQSVIISPEVSGTIEKISVTANQDVKTGQLLVQLSSDKAKATVIEAQAYLNDEKRKLDEYERLRKSAAVTLTELEGQRASVAIATARLSAAKAELSDRSLRAPFDGRIGFIDFSLGKFVNSGMELFSLDNLNVMELDLLVPERYLPLIATDMKVSVVSSAWGERLFEGRVVGIDSRVNPDTLNLRVRVDIENSAGVLKPGMLVQGTMQFPSIKAPIIPVQSLQYLGTKRFVYVVDEENHVSKREVFLGARVKNEVVIEKGLEIDETVVVQGVINMRDGIKVKIVGEQESDSEAKQ